MMVYILAFMITLGMQCTFASDQLSQERINLVGNNSAVSSYKKINENWHYIKSSTDIKTDSKCWKAKVVTVSPTQTSAGLLWDHEKQPCIEKAVKSVLNSATHSECLNATRMVKIKIISDILGPEKMRCLISKVNSTHKELGSFNFLTALSWAFQAPCEDDFQGVCSMSFVNIPWYPIYKPKGNARNHNVIKLSDGRFIGFDPVFFTHPRTYDELERNMYEEFISSKDIAEDNRAEYEQFCKVLESKGGFEAYKSLRREYQAKHKPHRFDVSKIERFIKTGEL